MDGPLRGKYLLLGSDERKNHASISQFSAKDADAFPKYETFLMKVRDLVGPLLDGPPPSLFGGKAMERRASVQQMLALARKAVERRDVWRCFACIRASDRLGARALL